MRMNDFDGKEFLAAVRGKDYAHAGEDESINLVFEKIPRNAERKILDVGCGRGGTADYVQRNGWGRVVGADIDEKSIEYACTKYPELEFHVCGANDLGARFPSSFDLIYLFNAFYAFEDKLGAVRSMRETAKAGARLYLFDYVWYQPDIALPEVMLSNKPCTPEEFNTLLHDSKWELAKTQNLDKQYVKWYRDFLDRFDALAEKRSYSGEMIEAVRKKYSDLLFTLEEGIMGGVLLVAYAM